MPQIVEIRSYNLKPETGAEFHRLVSEQSIPMLKRWQVDVVAYGASLQDEDTYYLIRAYADINHLQQREDAFYGNDEWRQGPRTSILAMIDHYTTVVIEVDDTTLHCGICSADLSLYRTSEWQRYTPTS